LENTQEAVAQVIRYSRGTTLADLRPGLSIYLPVYQSDVNLNPYNATTFGLSCPEWKEFLRLLKETVGRQNEVSGIISWPSHPLSNMRFFISTAHDGAAVVPFSVPLDYTQVFQVDSANYHVAFTMELDSVDCYLGAFRDRNGNESLDTGDSLGYYKRVGDSASRTWLTLHKGDVLDSINVRISTVVR
jgi:hypothetical protein